MSLNRVPSLADAMGGNGRQRYVRSFSRCVSLSATHHLPVASQESEQKSCRCGALQIPWATGGSNTDDRHWEMAELGVARPDRRPEGPPTTRVWVAVCGPALRRGASCSWVRALYVCGREVVFLPSSLLAFRLQHMATPHDSNSRNQLEATRTSKGAACRR
ncbi:hypothetical protein BKA80DRAFT_283653 [Phyllosticta citrichinensis]